MVTILDKEIDFFHSGVPKHLGQIAKSLCEWEGRIADELGLSTSDVNGVKHKFPLNLEMQTYVHD